MEQIILNAQSGFAIISSPTYTISDSTSSNIYWVKNDALSLVNITFDITVNPERIFVFTCGTPTKFNFPIQIYTKAGYVSSYSVGEGYQVVLNMDQILSCTTGSVSLGILGFLSNPTFSANTMITGYSFPNTFNTTIINGSSTGSLFSIPFTKTSPVTIIKSTVVLEVTGMTNTAPTLIRFKINVYPNTTDNPLGVLIPTLTSNQTLWTSQGFYFTVQASSGSSSGFQAFDNNASTQWLATSGENEVLTIKSPHPVKVSRFTLAPMIGLTRLWTSWEILGYNIYTSTQVSLFKSTTPISAETTFTVPKVLIPCTDYTFNGYTSNGSAGPNGLTKFQLIQDDAPDIIYSMDGGLALDGVNRACQLIVKSKKSESSASFSTMSVTSNQGATLRSIRWFTKTLT